MKKDIEKAIRDALRGLSQGDEVRIDGSPLMSGMKEPPSYLVHALLSAMLGFKWTNEDKSVWAIHVAFKGKQFLLHDWKASSWSIYSRADDSEAVNAAKELQRKLVFGGRLLDQALGPELEQHVRSGEFYLLNSYQHVRSAYEHFCQVLESEIRGLKELGSTIPPMEPDPQRDKTVTKDGFTKGGIKITHLGGFSEHMTKILRTKQDISHNAAAVAGFFYSYTELLFDTVFALSDPRSMTYQEFRALTWAERFKTTFPISTDKDIAATYVRLGEIKRVRDVMLHGFGGEPALLVPFGPFGLVPVSYKLAQSNIHYSWVPIRESEAEDMLQSFSEFDNWIENSDFHWYTRRFAESSFEIPFAVARVAEVRKWMASRSDFNDAIEREGEWRDHVSNQY